MKQEYTAPEAKLLVFSPNEALASFSFDDLLEKSGQPGVDPGGSDLTIRI